MKTTPNRSPEPFDEERSGIGTLNEHSLHADLIRHLAQPDDQLEVEIKGYYADILRGGTIFEIQTRNLAALKKKLLAFSPEYQVAVVYPISQTKWIIRQDTEGNQLSRRKSPKSGRIADIFAELVHAWDLIEPAGVSLHLVLIDSEEVWQDDRQGSWRRKFWSISERHLLKVNALRTFQTSRDFLNLLPPTLPEAFTNKDLAAALGVRSSLAGKISYTLRKMGYLKLIGKNGNQNIFEILKDDQNAGR